MLSSDEISDANAIVVCRHCRVSGGQTFPPDLSLCLIALVRLCQIVVPDIDWWWWWRQREMGTKDYGNACCRSSGNQ
jgi:hypothetical protein